MYFEKKTLRAATVCAGLMCIYYIFSQYISFDAIHAPTVSVNCILVSSICLTWGMSVMRRFSQKQMSRHIMLFIFSFVLLIFMRTVKYAFVPWDGALQRHLWYAYYLPLTVGPAAMLHASMYLGKPDDYRVSRRMNLLYIIALIISAAVMSNDFHFLSFRFRPGFDGWQSDYSRGPLYYLVVAWIAVTVAGMVFYAVRSVSGKNMFKRAWLPFCVLTAVIVFGSVRYIAGVNAPLFFNKIEFPEFICFSTIAFWESLVTARIIPCNTDYPAFFAASSLRAGLADSNLTVRQVSVNGISPTPEELRRAQGRDFLLPDGSTLLKTRPVRGGLFYWTEDIAALRRLNEELEETADWLNEENSMMRLSAEIDESHRKNTAQLELYDRVTQALYPQLDTLSGIVHTLPEDEESFCSSLKTIGVLLAYCKRKGNMLLQADTDPVVSGAEIQPGFDESAKALRLAGIPSLLSADTSVELSVSDAAVIYTAFETMLEDALPYLSSLTFSLGKETDGIIRFCFQAKLKTESPADDILTQVTRAANETEREISGAEIRFDIGVISEGGTDL